MRERIRSARGEDGFTLVELLIVIVVLGVLAGIVVFGVGKFKEDATSAACNADVKTAQTAADAFTAKTGGTPADIKALVDGKYLKTTPATKMSIAGGTVTPDTAC